MAGFYYPLKLNFSLMGRKHGMQDASTDAQDLVEWKQLPHNVHKELRERLEFDRRLPTYVQFLHGKKLKGEYSVLR